MQVLGAESTCNCHKQKSRSSERLQVSGDDSNGTAAVCVCTHVLADSVHGERVRRVLVGDAPHPAWHGGAEQQHLALFHLPSKNRARAYDGACKPNGRHEI